MGQKQGRAGHGRGLAVDKRREVERTSGSSWVMFWLGALSRSIGTRGAAMRVWSAAQPSRYLRGLGPAHLLHI